MNETELQQLNTQFETSTPQEVLTWAISAHRPTVILSSSFGSQSAALLHMASQIWSDIPVVFLNTGFLFKETLMFVDALKNKLHLNVREFKADVSSIVDVRKRLEDPMNADGSCCDSVKVALMQKALEGVTCWISGLRRNQSAARKNIGCVESYGSGLLKVHPLANWTSKDIYNYMKAQGLPFHPLWEKGYTSIGCEPCTTLPLPEEDDRSGRWAGKGKTECGIHTFLKK